MLWGVEHSSRCGCSCWSLRGVQPPGGACLMPWPWSANTRLWHVQAVPLSAHWVGDGGPGALLALDALLAMPAWWTWLKVAAKTLSRGASAQQPAASRNLNKQWLAIAAHCVCCCMQRYSAAATHGTQVLLPCTPWFHAAQLPVHPLKGQLHAASTTLQVPPTTVLPSSWPRTGLGCSGRG